MPESREIAIANNGGIIRLSYSALLEYHGGGAVFGATVGFRALQAAYHTLSSTGPLGPAIGQVAMKQTLSRI